MSTDIRMRKYKTKLLKKLTKEFLEEQYINLKKSMQVIANEIDCGQMTIFRYLNTYNIPIRNRSEAAKNKSPVTEETRQKMSEAQKDENNPMYGKYQTEESCQKISNNHADFKGENNPNFKGGRIKNSQGYVLIYSPDHPNKDKNNNVRESRLIVEFQIGRYLDPKWVVHHINGIKDDNRPKNLMCFLSKSAHQRFHRNPENVKPEEIIFDGREL